MVCSYFRGGFEHFYPASQDSTTNRIAFRSTMKKRTETTKSFCCEGTFLPDVQGYGGYQRACAIPHNLHSDTNQ
jgi:hypothetical protein